LPEKCIGVFVFDFVLGVVVVVAIVVVIVLAMFVWLLKILTLCETIVTFSFFESNASLDN